MRITESEMAVAPVPAVSLSTLRPGCVGVALPLRLVALAAWATVVPFSVKTRLAAWALSPLTGRATPGVTNCGLAARAGVVMRTAGPPW